MVTDLQGAKVCEYHIYDTIYIHSIVLNVQFSDKFILTDPAIHCQDITRFGRTNFGAPGITELFKMNHKCNSVCNVLKLSPL